jgi:hypothetical protein
VAHHNQQGVEEVILEVQVEVVEALVGEAALQVEALVVNRQEAEEMLAEVELVIALEDSTKKATELNQPLSF